MKKRRLSITMNLGATPKATDKIVQYNDNDPTLIDAEAIVENAYIIDADEREYSLSISLTHRGEFVKNKIATLIDRDGVTNYQGTIKGIVASIDSDNGSIYFRNEDNNGDLLTEDGDGLLMET